MANALPASAEDAPNGAEDVAETVAAVAPPIDIVAPRSTPHGVLSLGNGATAFPTTGEGDLVIASSLASPELVPDITIALPFEADVAEASAEVTSDGTVVYTGEGSVDLAIQSSETGVRLQTILNDASAPSEYTYTFEGLSPKLNADGTVDLIQESEGIAITVGHIEEPWARDARGRSVATSYRVEGDSVIQTVARASAYPVVADPSVQTSCVWYGMCYVKLDRATTKKVANGTALASIAAGILALIPNPVSAAIAGVISLRLAADSYAAGYYYDRGNCLAYALPVYAWGNPMSWAPYELKRGSYNCS